MFNTQISQDNVKGEGKGKGLGIESNLLNNSVGSWGENKSVLLKNTLVMG